jgi:putative hydrolase of the HAD superfamily
MIQAQVQNIVLDLGNVIIDLDMGRTERAMKQLLDIPYDSYHDHVPAVFTMFETGRISVDQFLAELLTHGKPGVTSDDLTAAWNAMLLEIPQHRIDLIHELARRYKVFILSNTNSIHENCFNSYLKERYGLSSLLDLPFQQVYFSHIMHLRKPDVECFEFVTKDAGISGTQTLFVDDHLRHVSGALQAGWLAVHKPPEIDLNRAFFVRLNIL